MLARSALLAVALSFGSLATELSAQQPERVPVLGVLMLSAGSDDPVVGSMRRGLHDLGYVEGRDFRIEHRVAEGRSDRLPRLADELVRLKVDVIVTGSDQTTRAAKEASSSIPIVAIWYNDDPVDSGFIERFNRPGGNITGLTVRNSELAGKRLELLKESLPRLSRVAVFWDAQGRRELEELRRAAPAFAVELQSIELQPPYDLDAAFKAAKRNKAGAIMVLASTELYVRCAILGARALQNNFAVSSSFHALTQAGGLMSYTTDPVDGYYRAAYFIDRLLKGAKPSDLPFETANVRLALNLKTPNGSG